LFALLASFDMLYFSTDGCIKLNKSLTYLLTIGTMTAFLMYLEHRLRTALFMIVIHHEVIN